MNEILTNFRQAVADRRTIHRWVNESGASRDDYRKEHEARESRSNALRPPTMDRYEFRVIFDFLIIMLVLYKYER